MKGGAYSRRYTNPASSLKYCTLQKQHLKISPGEFSKTAAMWEGVSFSTDPPIPTKQCKVFGSACTLCGKKLLNTNI